MPLISLVCPSCGAKLDFAEERENYFCEYCGAKVVFDKQYVNVSGNVNVSGIASAENLLTRADIFLKDGDFDNAAAYYERALDGDPKSSRAYMGKLLCRHRLRTIAELANSGIILRNDSEFNNAFSFANEEQKQILSNVADQTEANYNAVLKKLTDKLDKDKKALPGLKETRDAQYSNLDNTRDKIMLMIILMCIFLVSLVTGIILALQKQFIWALMSVFSIVFLFLFFKALKKYNKDLKDQNEKVLVAEKELKECETEIGILRTAIDNIQSGREVLSSKEYRQPSK